MILDEHSLASRTILPCFQQVNQTWARDPIKKLAPNQQYRSKKHLTSMSCQLEPAIWSRDTGQRIPCFDRCQLIITWMSNTKEVHSKPKLHVSLSTYYLKYGSHLARLHRRRRRRRRRRAYAPTSNTASHDNHEKINSWVSFCFPYMGCLWGSAGRRSSAINFEMNFDGWLIFGEEYILLYI